MYLSLLKLNPASRKAMAEVSRPYELHRTIMRAFPSAEDGGAGRVLFRLDVSRDASQMNLLVQSEKKPDWSALKGTGDMLLEQPGCKAFNPSISPGRVFYFRLRANPTVKRDGKRLGIPDEEGQSAWLKRKSAEAGFELLSVTVVDEGKVQDKMTDSQAVPHDLTLISVRFEGLLKVTDADKFKAALMGGIGSAKGMGFGLLSIASPRDS